MDGLFTLLIADIDRQPAKLVELILHAALPMILAFVAFWIGARLQTINGKPGWIKWAMAAPLVAYSCFKCYQYFGYIMDSTYRDVLYSQGLNRAVYLHYATLPAAGVSILALIIWAGILRSMSSDTQLSY